MSARVLEGPKVAAAIDEQTAAKAKALAARGIEPCLGILRVGCRPDDISYERGAAKRAEKCGIAVRSFEFPESVTTEELIAQVEAINGNDAIHGLLMLRPFPEHVREHDVCNALDAGKDVDACTDEALSSVFTGSDGCFAPCTAQASIEILEHYGIEIAGKRAVVIGRSLVIGKPVAMMLLDRNATVTIAHSRTQDLAALVRKADIVVACVGRALMVDCQHLAEGQTVIDVGINFADGKMCGDVHYEEAVELVDAITPVPGGVGAVTTSVLCKHVIEAAERA